jgi:sugar lactone lactonase YvrE
VPRSKLAGVLIGALTVASAPGSAAAIPSIPALHRAAPPTSGIVASADGTVYFVDSYNRTVWRVAPDGSITPFVTGRNGRSLHVDAHGNLYGTHEESRGRLVLWRADRAGRTVEVARTQVPAEHGHAFVLDGAGEVIGWTGTGRRSGVRLWRAREHQRQLVAGGAWGTRDGAGADARFLPIGGMTRCSEGDLFVTSGASIRRITAAGDVSTVVADERLLQPRATLLQRLFGDVQGDHLSGIAVDGNGVIYVTNTAREAVIRVERGGRTREVLRSDTGWTPTGVAVAGDVVYVLEYGAGVRVRRVAADGVPQVLAMVRPERSPGTSGAGLRARSLLLAAR